MHATNVNPTSPVKVANSSYSGTLHQAVVVDALVSTSMAPLLFFITKAHGTANGQLVVGIALFMVSMGASKLQSDTLHTY